jgi:subtilisin family serine protease
LVCLALVGSSRAQRPAATFPVIVVFSDTASFEQFRGQYRPDDRAAADPDAWDYLDHAVAGAAQAFERQMGFRADHVFSAAIRGFSAHLTAAQIQAVERNPLVSYVEADGEMSISTQVLPWGINRINADISSTLAGNGSGAVSNVHVYIIDTGSDATHPDLNVINHVNFANGPNKDCNGHGTHVSGTVAARDNTIDVVGVAPGAPITGVKVLGCGGSGTTSGVIKGVDWVTANAIKPAIANMSLGGGASSALDNAVINSANSGVFYSLAAGNSSANACNSSPARAGTTNGVMTVAATDSADREASFSNFGPCVDLWAPGVSVLSTKNGGGTTTLSGTSMASPHAGGTGALYLSSHPGATAATVESALKSASVATGTNSKDGRAIKLVYAGTF